MASRPVAEHERLEGRRSAVRVYVTYAAMAFLFGGGAVMIIGFIAAGMTDEALTVFTTVLPTTTLVIGYWFAKRQADPSVDAPTTDDGSGGDGNSVEDGEPAVGGVDRADADQPRQ